MRRNLGVLYCLLSLMTIFSTTSAIAQDIANDSVVVKLPALDYNNPKKYVIEDIKVSGVKYLSTELIVGTTGITKGDTIYLPSDFITNVISQMWSQRYYSNIKVMVDVEDDKAFLDIQIKERPRVSDWLFTGLKGSEEKELKEEKLKLRKRVELSDFSLKTSQQIILDYLYEKGYRNAEVTVKQEDDEMMDNFRIVTFEVDKGPKVKIEKINFIGNDQLLDKKLKASMKKTKEKTILNLFKSAKLNEEEFEADKLLVQDYMRSKGYRDGVVISDSVYTINDKRIGIDLKVEEGNKYYYRNINWIGNVKYPTETLNQMLGIVKGDTYDKLTMDERLGIGSEGAEAMMSGAQNVSTIYKNDGHLRFELTPVEKVVGADSIDLDLKISEGKQFTVNNVVISGNNRTSDRVIRRELYIRPGEMYDQSMLIHTIRQLGNMKHFNAENISPDIVPATDELVNISFPLEEVASDNVEVAGGWGSGMFIGSASIAFNNVSLRKFFDKGAWRPYPSGDNQMISLSAQTNGTYYQAYSLGFTEPWLGGKRPNALSVSIYYSSQSDYYSQYYSQYASAYSASDSKFMTLGAAISLSKRLTWPDPNFILSGELSYKAYNLNDWDYFLMKDGMSNTIAATVTLSRTSTDQALYPRTGSEMFLKGTITPPWSMFNDKDYSDKSMTDQERYKWIEYYKISGMARFFIPMADSKLVLMGRGEFGYLGAYNKDNLSPFEGFTVGGDGISGYTLYGIDNIGLRGYENGSLTPYADYGTQGRSYVKYTTELRYPVILSPQSSVYGLIFAEAGNAFYDWKSFNPFNLKKSLGVGVRLYLPVVGMFGIDWGYGFDTAPGNKSVSGGQFHFSIGQSF